MGLACGGVLKGGDGKRVLSRGWLRRSGVGGSLSGLARGRCAGGRDYLSTEGGGDLSPRCSPRPVLGSLGAAQLWLQRELRLGDLHKCSSSANRPSEPFSSFS